MVTTEAGLMLPSAARVSAPLRYAVLGAGFAGLSVAYNLLKHTPSELSLCLDIYDEVGIGGGASGVSGGLLHPYSPKAKLLWRGDKCWEECLNLLNIAEAAVEEKGDEYIVRRRGIIKPAMSMKNFNALRENAQHSHPNCKIQFISADNAQDLVPHLCVPCNAAFYMPHAVNIHPQRYLQALFLACENLVREMSTLGSSKREFQIQKKSIDNLRDLACGYDAVIICLGAKADTLPELQGKLPLRTCRGVIAHLVLPDGIEDIYPDNGPSVLSDAWLAVQGSRSLYMGATWDWGSRNYSTNVSNGESSRALEELLPKVLTVYPGIDKWTFAGARAGLRAIPPLTPAGSLPLLGCVDSLVGGEHTCKYWLFGGLGSRGLLYHALLGKLMAQAVLSCNDELIPSELTSWIKLKQRLARKFGKF